MEHSTENQQLLPILLADPPQKCIISSSTGSGKTLAMAIAILSRVDVTKGVPQVLCVTGSYESSVYFSDILGMLSEFSNVAYNFIVRGAQCEKTHFTFTL